MFVFLVQFAQLNIDYARKLHFESNSIRKLTLASWLCMDLSDFFVTFTDTVFCKWQARYTSHLSWAMAYK